MTEQDLIIQELRRENEWLKKRIELAERALAETEKKLLEAGGGIEMKINPNRLISEEILDIIEWISAENNSLYEKGILTGLRMAEQLAEAIERNSEVRNETN